MVIKVPEGRQIIARVVRPWTEKNRKISDQDRIQLKYFMKDLKAILLDLGGKLDYTVDEMLFIDDSQGKLDSAALHGIEGVLFRDNAQLKTTLKEYL